MPETEEGSRKTAGGARLSLPAGAGWRGISVVRVQRVDNSALTRGALPALLLRRGEGFFQALQVGDPCADVVEMADRELTDVRAVHFARGERQEGADVLDRETELA